MLVSKPARRCNPVVALAGLAVTDVNWVTCGYEREYSMRVKCCAYGDPIYRTCYQFAEGCFENQMLCGRCGADGMGLGDAGIRASG